MSGRDPIGEPIPTLGLSALPASDGEPRSGTVLNSAALVGELIAFVPETHMPLVRLMQGTGAAVTPARTVVPLQGEQIGRQVLVICEDGDPGRPIVVGVLVSEAASLSESMAAVEVRADGTHLLVSARDRIVLRCGKASITLTRAGKILIEGEYISSRAVGTQRIRGGSVELN